MKDNETVKAKNAPHTTHHNFEEDKKVAEEVQQRKKKKQNGLYSLFLQNLKSK